MVLERKTERKRRKGKHTMDIVNSQLRLLSTMLKPRLSGMHDADIVQIHPE